MPDNKFYPNPDEVSIDALLEETKMQIEAAPGEAVEYFHEVNPAPMGETQKFEPLQQPPQAQPMDFEPDFGDAFSDYGEYVPQQQPQYQQPYEPQYQQPYEPQYQQPYEPQYQQPYEPQYQQPYEPQYQQPYELQYEQSYVPETPEQEPITAKEEPKPKKPKRKTGKRIIPLFVKVLLYVVIVCVIAVGLGYGAWECARDVLAFGRSDEMVMVRIEQDDTVEDIAKMLEEKGIIKYAWLFEFYCDFTDSAAKIEPNKDGESYMLYYNYDYHALVSSMRNEVIRTEVRVTIPEGYTAEQIFKLMEDNGVCTVQELEQCASEYEFDFWFLEGIPYGEKNRLEGFLFPDTYDFYEADEPERVLKKLLNNFDKKFGDDARAKLDDLNLALEERWRNAGYDDDYIEDHRFTVYELMTVASMIEKEAAAFDEAGNISSVIYNRLCDPANYPYLNIDATVVYALGGEVGGALTLEDTKVDSPYNTYVTQGLPLGPICNPGLSSISAALFPTDTSYYYYALDMATGYHHFSKTYDEHKQFLEGQDYG